MGCNGRGPESVRFRCGPSSCWELDDAGMEVAVEDRECSEEVLELMSFEKDLTIAVRPAVCGSRRGRGTTEFEDPEDPEDCAVAVLGVALMVE